MNHVTQITWLNTMKILMINTTSTSMNWSNEYPNEKYTILRPIHLYLHFKKFTDFNFVTVRTSLQIKNMNKHENFESVVVEIIFALVKFQRDVFISRKWICYRWIATGDAFEAIHDFTPEIRCPLLWWWVDHRWQSNFSDSLLSESLDSHRRCRRS